MRRARRLRKGVEFDTAYQKGTVERGPLLLVRVRPNGLGRDRWGFAVGKRLVKLAHDRNRVRRRLREAALRVPQGSTGRDIVVVAREGALTASLDALAGELRRLLERASRRGGGDG